MTQSTPVMRSLSPTYVADQHDDYVKLLTASLARSDAGAPRNIALTGHYGSGKSSVLVETQRRLEHEGAKVINLSLPSLGIGDGRIPVDGDKSLDKTNLIQKEIVKQLLYRRKPSAMPASRYSRLDTFDVWRARRTAFGFGVAAAGFALLARVPTKVRDALPAKAWSWIDEHLWGNLAVSLQWLSLLVVLLLAASIATWAQRLLQERFRVTELAAGPTKVTLSDTSSSYFDEYLDEIVYFFQTSKTVVVIFEDLDRFRDPHIFETLRELNLLLNNAEQTGSAPIRFVYAIRDSIFEQLDVEGADSGDGAVERDAITDRSETRRLMSTNRTKFFDLVVPMVPFISHRTSRDLIRQELDAIEPDKRPSNAVIDIVGAHLTDMRLIKNICNEYEVFRRRILTDGGLKELTADRLFASIVYKNLYLADYEKIRDGTSLLDTLYRAYRNWVTQQTAVARATERTAKARLRRIDTIGPRSASLGTRLQNVLQSRHVQNVKTTNVRVNVAGTDYAWSDLCAEGFWRAYLQSRGDLAIYYRPGYGPESISFDKVQTLMGYTLAPDAWADEAKSEANREVAAAVANLRSAQHASMTDALGETDRLFSHDGDDRTVADVADELFEGADVVLELLRAGLIDENFTLYITQFPGQTISACAMNFIIKAVQPDAMDIEYHFGTSDGIDAGDIKAVLDAEEGRLLGGQSIYNIELFDYLLVKDPIKLIEPIKRLASGSDQTFIDAYLVSGKAADGLVERLSACWPGIFDYVIGDDLDTGSERLLDAALRGADPKLTYTVGVGQRVALAEAIPRLPTITTPQPQDRATAVASTIEKLALRVEDLTVVAEPLRGELATRSLYPVTLPNLCAILLSDEFLPLDWIKDSREKDVYPHVLMYLNDYLVALDEAAEIPSVANASQFVEVLKDVGKADVDVLRDVARRASADCMLTDLNQMEAALWPALAAAHKLTLSAQNVATYIAEHDVDAGLAHWLSTAGAIAVGPDDATPLVPLATRLLNAAGLGDDVTLQLVESLGIEPRSVAAADLEKRAHTMLPALVRDGLIPDDADTYMVLEDDEWPIKEQVIAVSENFSTYMPSLTLSANDLLAIASMSVPQSVKDVLLAQLATFKETLGQQGAVALANWAATNGRTPTAEAIVTLATKGGDDSARPVLKLLGDQAGTIDLDMLRQALVALGRPYSQLTTPGRDRPKIGTIDGVEVILERLRKAGIVSKFHRNTKKKVFEVSKRHS